MSDTLVLAPLHGVTNKTFRAAYFRHFGGFDAAFAPFILACRVSKAKPTHFKDLMPGPGRGNAAREIPLVPQLLGDEPLAFAETARVLADMGYREINVNLGCPYPMVAKKGRGSGLLPYPDRVERILDATLDALAASGAALSVKLRLGRADASEIDRLMPALNERPLARVVIHPRIGTQMYRGTVDLEGFSRAAASCAHPVAYNGDIRDVATFVGLRARFPSVREWMIGRWAISDPFLAEDIRARLDAGNDDGETATDAPGPIGARVAIPADRLARVAAFHDDLYASYREILCGPAHALDKMKEVWSYLGAWFPKRGRDLERLARAKTLDEYERAARAILVN